jgi:hypothetical protein
MTHFTVVRQLLLINQAACKLPWQPALWRGSMQTSSLFVWLAADGWFVLREKYCWLVADKPNEQGALWQPALWRGE